MSSCALNSTGSFLAPHLAVFIFPLSFLSVHKCSLMFHIFTDSHFTKVLLISGCILSSAGQLIALCGSTVDQVHRTLWRRPTDRFAGSQLLGEWKEHSSQGLQASGLQSTGVLRSGTVWTTTSPVMPTDWPSHALLPNPQVPSIGAPAYHKLCLQKQYCF